VTLWRGAPRKIGEAVAQNLSQMAIAQAIKSSAAGIAQRKWNSYYSRVRLVSSVLTANAYIAAAGPQVTAFGYGKGQDMAAGGVAGTNATACDTNILQANQTLAGETVVVQGISIILLGQSDANFAKQLDQNVSVAIVLNGTTVYRMGIPSMIPGCGGLYGASESISVVSDLQSQVGRQIGALSNGVPMASNFFPLPGPMIWNPAGKGDSNFAVQLVIERTTTTWAGFGGVTRAAIADVATVNGVAPYTAPTAAQVFADYMIVLVGPTSNPLSDN
jgi:hypothetical protein